MIDPVLFTEGLESIRKFFATHRNDLRLDRSEIEEALIALNDAATSTKKYYHNNQPGDEYEIAQKWYTVSIRFKKFDTTLSKKFDVKAKYWEDLGDWPDELVRDVGIKLEHITREAKMFLHSK